MNITIIGSGNMAKGIGTRLVHGGHRVAIHARDDAEGEQLVEQLNNESGTANASTCPIDSDTDEIVVLAVPYGEVEAIAKEYGNFSGKTVVDITNPVDFATFQLLPEPGTSGAEEIAALLPEAKIVKAFNTTLAGPLAIGEIDGKKLDVFVASDDNEAKEKIKEMISTSGMRAIDVGPLSESRHLEGFGLIQMKIQDQIGTNWMSALKFLG